MNTNFKNSLNNETKNENKWCARLAYKCGICGKEYESIASRAECELACVKKQEEEKAKAAAEKKKAEKAARQKEVDQAYKKFCDLRNAFIKDYDEYVFYTTETTLGADNWLEKLYLMLP